MPRSCRRRARAPVLSSSSAFAFRTHQHQHPSPAHSLARLVRCKVTAAARAPERAPPVVRGVAAGGRSATESPLLEIAARLPHPGHVGALGCHLSAQPRKVARKYTSTSKHHCQPPRPRMASLRLTHEPSAAVPGTANRSAPGRSPQRPYRRIRRRHIYRGAP